MHSGLFSRGWNNRWARALVVAAAIGAWPACALTHTKSAGKPANLDFVLKDVEGRDVRLADLKGRPLLVNFWATWCPPCKAEIPSFVELADKYKDQKLTVVGISVDDSAADIKKFATDYKVNYLMLVGDGHRDLLSTYEAADVIPVSWLIRADGTILTKIEGIHPKDWFDTQLKPLLPGLDDE